MKNSIELTEGFKISRVVTGLWQIADMERSGKTLDAKSTAKNLEDYVKAGFTSFDMADHYGSSEIIAGVLQNNLEESDKLQLFTKWVPPPGKITKTQVREAVKTSLTRMQVESIDLMQFHAWNYPDPSWLDGLYYLAELREEGLIKHLGVTNFDTPHLRIALSSGIPIVSNQVSFSLLDQRAAGKMSELCHQFNVKLLAFGTLAGGFISNRWFGKDEPVGELANWSQMKYKRYIDTNGGWSKFQKVLGTLNSIAEKHDSSISNVASSFILDHQSVAAIIIGARPGVSDHLVENKKIFHLTLDEEDKNQIKSSIDTLNNIPGDCGDEYRHPPYLTASGDLSHHLESFPLPYEVVQIDERRSKVFSGTIWEDEAGYCRAIREGNQIHVSGTTSTHGDKMIGGNDVYAQAHFIIDKIEGAINSLGGSLKDVIRTRIFVNDVDDWEGAARAHGERFREIQPANTLVEAKLVGEGYLVEIEAQAIVRD